MTFTAFETIVEGANILNIKRGSKKIKLCSFQVNSKYV